jgi:hypothetical protein
MLASDETGTKIRPFEESFEAFRIVQALDPGSLESGGHLSELSQSLNQRALCAR